MDVLFVNNLNFSNSMVLDVPNAGILNLASILKSNYTVEIFDLSYEQKKNAIILDNDYELFSNNLVDMILSYDARIIGFTTMCDTYPIVLDLAKKIKLRSSGTKIILGGPQASITAEETMRAFDFIDLIAIGESELNILSIVEALLSPATGSLHKLESIKNIVFRNDDYIVTNPKELLCIDMSALPAVDDLFIGKYYEFIQSYSIDVGRGCPYSCTFCCTNDMWNRKFRLKPIDKIIDEIRHINMKFGVKNFNFLHDLFTANREVFLQFCEAIIQSGLDITWGCSARIDTIDDDMIRSMAQAKCTNIYLGIETGSQRMQSLIKKKLPLEHVVPKVRVLKQNGLRVTCSFIFGFVDEGENDLLETLSLISELIQIDVTNIQLHRFTPYPKTEELDKVYDKLYFDTKNLNCHIIETRYLDNFGEMIAENKMLFSNFYEFDSDVRSLKWRSLDTFVASVRVMHKFFKCIYGIFFREYGNIANAYHQYSTWIDNEIRSIDVHNGLTNLPLVYQEKLIKVITRITEDLSETENKSLLSVMHEFGKDMFYFSVNEKCSEEIKEYPINVVSLNIKGVDANSSEIYERTRVRFTKDLNGKLNFRRVL